MRTLLDIDEKPYIEIIAGRWVEKVSGTRRHGSIQIQLGSIVMEQARDRGYVASEWRFHLCRDPENRTTLVPDVAFVSRARLLALPEAEREMPPISPDIAVEIRSPSGRERDIQEKISLYLEYGSALMLDVDPDRSVVVAHTRDGITTYGEGERFTHAATPWLTFDIASLFAEATAS